MDRKPVVSIITPTYNHESYISQCIDSVLNQTFRDWEMIIIDDGSTDKTPNIISKYNDSRIKLIQQENRGAYNLADNYNKALSVSKGDFIAILEGDDYWPPKKLEHQLKGFKDEKVILTHGRAKHVYGLNENIKNVYIREINNIVNNNPTGTALYGLLGVLGSTPVAVTVMIRKSALIRIGGFQKADNVPLTDNLTELELSLVGRFKYIKKNLGYFRRHDSSITHKIRDDKIKISLFEYRLIFLNKNAEKILKFNLPLNKFYNMLLNTKKISYPEHSLIHARELHNLAKYKDSRIVFASVLRNKKTKVSIHIYLLTIIGLLGSYTHLDLLDPILRCFSRLESFYWNFKFE